MILRISLGFAVFFAAAHGASAARAEPANGQIDCVISENGEEASGTIVLLKDGQEVLRATCGKLAAVPAGKYTAVLGLDGALDAPELRQDVVVEKGNTARVVANFAMGTLEVKIESQGKRAAGVAIIRKAGKQIGTLGSGVKAHLSAGTYEISARYRDQTQTISDVAVAQGAARVVDVRFE